MLSCLLLMICFWGILKLRHSLTGPTRINMHKLAILIGFIKNLLIGKYSKLILIMLIFLENTYSEDLNKTIVQYSNVWMTCNSKGDLNTRLFFMLFEWWSDLQIIYRHFRCLVSNRSNKWSEYRTTKVNCLDFFDIQMSCIQIVRNTFRSSIKTSYETCPLKWSTNGGF